MESGKENPVSHRRKKDAGFLRDRVKHLEDINRFTLDALDMITGLEDSHPSITRLPSPLPIVADMLRRVDLLIPFKAKAVCFVDERDADFSLRLVQPDDWRPWMESEMEAAVQNDVFGWALREKRPVMVPSSDGKVRFLLHAMTTTTRVRGMFLGVLPLEGDEIHDVYWSLLSIVLQRSANALESFELYRIINSSNITLKEQIKERANLLEYMTWFDQLTGLPNKAMLGNRLEREFSAMVSGTSGAVSLLVIDLDRFKDFNEALGRQAADQILRKVGQRIVETVKDSGVVTRFGGDEFAVILPGQAQSGALEVARRIFHEVSQPIEGEDEVLHLEVSIGLAVAPDHAGNADDLLSRSEVAMYVAKSGKAGVACYNPSIEDKGPHRVYLLGELHRALEQGELYLEYQPIYDLRSRSLAQVEALARWKHPKRGLISPVLFVPLAEQSGLIQPMTLSILRMAVQQAREWSSAGLSFPVAVNLSARNLQDPDLPRVVAGMLQEAGLDPAQLVLEITETAILHNPGLGFGLIRQFRDLGVGISIDDFGSGYTSLMHLKTIDAQSLKIDKEFIVRLHKDQSDVHLVRSIVELGHNLGMHLVAEGVENARIHAILRDFKCDMAQGYHLCRPVAPEEIPRKMTLTPS